MFSNFIAFTVGVGKFLIRTFFLWMLVNFSVFTTVYRLCIANPWHCFTRFPALLVRSVSCFSAEGER